MSKGTIGDISKTKLHIVPGMFEPRRFEFLRFFEHARTMCKKFIVPSSGLNAAIAVAVPVYDKAGKVSVSIPILEVNSNLQREGNNSSGVVQTTLANARSGELIVPLLECTVGVAIAYFSTENGQLPPDICNKFTVDVRNSSSEVWVCLSEPAARYSECFRPWSSTTTPTSNYVKPIILTNGGPLIGVIGVDFVENPTQEHTTELRLLLENLEILLQGVYFSYYSHLDPPSDELGIAIKACGLELQAWESVGRVLGRKYLEEFSAAVQSEGLKQFGGEDALLLYCDGNGIKDVNDAAGHHVGNEVIRLIGGVLWRSIVKMCTDGKSNCTDGFVVRWGGDEFVVALILKSSLNLMVEGTNDNIGNESQLADDFCQYVRVELEEAMAALNKVLQNTKGQAKLPRNFGLAIGCGKYIDSEKYTTGREFDNVWKEAAEKAMYCCKRMMKFAFDLHNKGLLKRCPSNSFLANLVGSDVAEALQTTLIEALRLPKDLEESAATKEVAIDDKG